MKPVLAVLLVAAAALLLTSSAAAAATPTPGATAAPAPTATPAPKASTPLAPRPQSFRLEGKIVQIYKGYFELSVTKVLAGPKLKMGQELRINETSKTRFVVNGKAAMAASLKKGESVRVQGVITKPSRYQATIVTVVK